MQPRHDSILRQRLVTTHPTTMTIDVRNASDGSTAQPSVIEAGSHDINWLTIDRHRLCIRRSCLRTSDEDTARKSQMLQEYGFSPL
jgi:hypothetical protein